MKKLSYFYFFGICSLIFTCYLYSCNSKDEISTTSPKLNTRTIDRLTDNEIAAIGTKHNQQLAYFFDSLIEAGPESFTDIEEFQDYVRDFPFKLDYNISEGFKDTIFNNVINETQFPSCFNYILGFIDSLDTYCNTISTINSAISSKMLQFKNDGNMSEIEFNVSMTMLSVYKNSAYFWFDSAYGGSGLGRSYMNSLNGLYANIYPAPNSDDPTQAIHWKKVAANDLLGAADGMLGWCCAAVWTGAGTLGALAGGALYGAVSGSVFGG